MPPCWLHCSDDPVRKEQSSATTEILNWDTVIRIRKNSLIKKARVFVVILASIASATAQTGASEKRAHPQPLVLTGAVPLANVQGRIDHLGVDYKGRLFVSALGNNSEEAIDLAAGRVTHSVRVPRPQGVVYAAASNELFVGSDEGKLYIYNGDSLELITSIDFGDDVDNLRYDAAKKLVYVAYGDDDAGAIAIIDATTNKRLEHEYKLGAHPESFQLETAGPNLYVNLPDLKQIAVINRSTRAITRWPLKEESNFPMALDEAGHTLFAVTHAPALLLAFDATTGHQVAALPTVQNSDDVFFDAARRRIYVPGGEGSIDVFQRTTASRYEKLARIPTAVGGR